MVTFMSSLIQRGRATAKSVGRFILGEGWLHTRRLPLEETTPSTPRVLSLTYDPQNVVFKDCSMVTGQEGSGCSSTPTTPPRPYTAYQWNDEDYLGFCDYLSRKYGIRQAMEDE